MRTISRNQHARPALVHSAEGFQSLLRRGLSPITDNRDALVALGCARAYPQTSGGYESTIWERSVEHSRPSAGYRMLARERALLDREAHR